MSVHWKPSSNCLSLKRVFARRSRMRSPIFNKRPEARYFRSEAAKELNIPHVGTLEAFEQLPESQESLRPSEPHEVAYLQYTSGSTLFPRGVVITQKAVLANLNEIIIHGLKLRPGDRAFSWLPFYHDMGLVG